MCIVNIPEETLSLATKGPSELTAITPTAEGYGQINPALKISREDLLKENGNIFERNSPPSPEENTLLNRTSRQGASDQ
jgi:hypothetical protein